MLILTVYAHSLPSFDPSTPIHTSTYVVSSANQTTHQYCLPPIYVAKRARHYHLLCFSEPRKATEPSADDVMLLAAFLQSATAVASGAMTPYPAPARVGRRTGNPGRPSEIRATTLLLSSQGLARTESISMESRLCFSLAGFRSMTARAKMEEFDNARWA